MSIHRKWGIGLLLTLGVVTAPFGVGAQTWGYLGDIGPDYWGELSPDYETCGSGDVQSPVDIGKSTLQNPTSQVSIDYESSVGSIFNNGHTIEVEIEEGLNILKLGGVEYELVQFHFHTPSEHTLKGRGYDMEMHLVHSADGVNSVLGVFLRRGPSSGALAPIFDSFPDDVTVHHELDGPFDPASFLPGPPGARKNYRYSGSLTTPPCTEGVHWVVLDKPVTVSDEHLAQFAERLHFNARRVQRGLP